MQSEDEKDRATSDGRLFLVSLLTLLGLVLDS
jgi:hypothetical protein